MVETFYLHLDFKRKNSSHSVNLPFLCSKCGVCCTLEDFLTAGEVTAKPEEQPEVHAKLKALFDELGEKWEKNEAAYDRYVAHTPCPFLAENKCSIYEFRPGGCRLFPNTAFGMLTTDCPALNRFKKQRAALRKGKAAEESYHSTGEKDIVKPAHLDEKQYAACVAKLRRAGVTEEELALFKLLNGESA